MEKPFKIILFIIVGLVTVNFGMSLFGSSSIGSIRKDLENAKHSADSALVELKNATIRLDSIKSDMFVLKTYIGHIQKTVELTDIEKQAKEEKNMRVLDSLKKEAKKLKADIATDSLPDVIIIDVKRN